MQTQAFKTEPSLNAVSVWLFVCLAMIFAMAVIGAVTRLTESGLSIMEWAPVKGFLPPLSEAEWQRLFGLYRQTGEFRFDNPDMDMAGFKTIFWWEWIHRFWGRTMGLVFAFGLAWFWIRRALPRWIKPYLAAALVLGGLQGTVGWFMVASGFDDGLTDVSHFRLALHLVFALILYGFLLLVTLAYMRRDLGFMRSGTGLHAGFGAHPAYLKFLTVFGTAFLVLVIVSGAFVAGKNAGLIYNEWPLMGGSFIPRDYRPLEMTLAGAALNHDTAIQFNHRWLALGLTLVTVLTALAGLVTQTGNKGSRRWFGFLLLAVVCQFFLGIMTLLTAVPVTMGALHQAGAITLLTVYLVCAYVVFLKGSGEGSA